MANHLLATDWGFILTMCGICLLLQVSYSAGSYKQVSVYRQEQACSLLNRSAHSLKSTHQDVSHALFYVLSVTTHTFCTDVTQLHICAYHLAIEFRQAEFIFNTVHTVPVHYLNFSQSFSWLLSASQYYFEITYIQVLTFPQLIFLDWIKNKRK